MDNIQNIEEKNDYIKHLTNALSSNALNSSSSSNAAIPRNIRDIQFSDDQSSIGDNSSTSSLLFKYGKEDQQDNNNTNKKDGILRRSSFDSQESDLKSMLSMDAIHRTVDNESTTNQNENDKAYMKFLMNKEFNKSKRSQFRNTTKQSMIPPCENCMINNKLQLKNKEVIRGLKLTIQRLDEQLHDLKKARTAELMNYLTVKASQDLEQTLKDEQLLKKRCEYFEDECNKMKKVVNSEKSANEGLKKTLEDTRTTLKQNIQDLHVKIIELQTDLDGESAKKNLLIKQNEELTSTLMLYKKQLEKSENKLSDCMLQLNAHKQNLSGSLDHLKEIERLKEALMKSDNDNKILDQKLTSKKADYNQLVMKMTVKDLAIKTVEDKVVILEEKLSRNAIELRSSSEMYSVAKKRVDVLEVTLATTTKEKELLNRTLISTEVNLEQSQQRNKEYEKEINNLNTKISDLLRKLTKESENTRLALEKAITSSVRLCVVAPTVNVHVADKKLKFKAGLSQNTLKQFLSAEVLEKYSFLFKQKTENSSPDGDSLETWLQSLLAQMQSSIEQHVQSAMEGSSL